MPVDDASDSPNEARRGDFTTTAYVIEQDFRRLVHTLKWMITSAEKSDVELIERLVCAKSAAQRGHRLSKLLTRLTRKPRD